MVGLFFLFRVFLQFRFQLLQNFTEFNVFQASTPVEFDCSGSKSSWEGMRNEQFNQVKIRKPYLPLKQLKIPGGLLEEKSVNVCMHVFECN